MKEMLDNKIDLLFTLDCGTTSNEIIDNKKFKKIDVIVIDHHLSEINLPNVLAIINPNRLDDESDYKQLAAVGVTFLFLMYLRKKLREINKFKEIKESIVVGQSWDNDIRIILFVILNNGVILNDELIKKIVISSFILGKIYL